LSFKKAAELTRKLFQITYMLPELKQTKSQLLKIDDQQAELYQIIPNAISNQSKVIQV